METTLFDFIRTLDMADLVYAYGAFAVVVGAIMFKVSLNTCKYR